MTEAEIARAICREECAFYGEPPCFEMDDDGVPCPWPNPHCDGPGCFALAQAVAAELAKQEQPNAADE